MIEEIVRFVAFIVVGLFFMWLAKSVVSEGVEEALVAQGDDLLRDSDEFRRAVRDAVIEALRARGLGQDG
jgi:hypothetical protein